MHRALQHALDEISAMVHLGRYEHAELLSVQFLKVPPAGETPSWIWSAVRYRQRPGPDVDHTLDRVSHIAIRPMEGFFNKVRYTYPAHFEERLGFSMFVDFLEDWQRAVELHTAGETTANPAEVRVERERAGDLPHPLGFLDPELASARQVALIRDHMEFKSADVYDPEYAERVATSHEFGHVLYETLARDMALSVEYWGASRRVDVRHPRAGGLT